MRLYIRHNTDKGHWPYRYVITSPDSDVRAYTNDTEIADWLNEDPSNLEEDYQIEHHREAVRKAELLFAEAEEEAHESED